MRIAFWFSAALGAAKGTPSRARNLAVHLGRRPGVELTVLSGDPEPVPALHGVRHLRFNGPAEGRRRLRETLHDWRPDIVYGHTHKALAPLAALRSGEAPRLVVDLHGDLAGERLEQTWRPLPRRIHGFVRDRLIERRLAPKMDAFTVVSHTLAERIRRFGLPVRVIWGGVDLELFRAAAPPASASLRIGYAGNFLPYQGVDTLLDAAARLLARQRDVSFTFVGDLDAFPEVARRARQLLGKRLELTGSVPYERVPELLGQLDVLVIPRGVTRSGQFGFPSKLAEYLALGRALVVTRVGDAARVVTDGESGLVVAPGDDAALADALEKLEDPSLRRRLGRGARALARSRLSWERLAAEVDDFLRQVIESHPAAVAGDALRSASRAE